MLPRQGSFPLPRRVSLPLLARSRLGSAEAGTAVAHRCLQGHFKEVPLLADALLPRRCHRVALVCSLGSEIQPFAPALRPALLRPRLTPPRPSDAVTDTLLRFARRAAEVSHGKTLHFPEVAAGCTRAHVRRSIGCPRPRPGCPTALALYPMSVRRPLVLPPVSSPPRITATQLPLASGSAPCGPQRTCTSKFSIMRGTPGSPLSRGRRICLSLGFPDSLASGNPGRYPGRRPWVPSPDGRPSRQPASPERTR
jgi:hypothetical protein